MPHTNPNQTPKRNLHKKPGHSNHHTNNIPHPTNPKPQTLSQSAPIPHSPSAESMVRLIKTISIYIVLRTKKYVPFRDIKPINSWATAKDAMK